MNQNKAYVSENDFAKGNIFVFQTISNNVKFHVRKIGRLAPRMSRKMVAEMGNFMHQVWEWQTREDVGIWIVEQLC